jgi:hypothetical protein
VNALDDAVRAKIVADSAELVRLHQAIRDTFARRSLSRHEHEEWSKACAKFHSEYANLFYPGGDERWDKFLNGDSAEIETAVLFLDVDPYFFRSGYMKEVIWTRLKKFDLSAPQRTRLEAIAIAYLHRRIRRDFWHMARYVRRHGRDEFWRQVVSLQESAIPSVRMKAGWLMLCKENWPVRTWINREVMKARFDKGYVPLLDFHLGEKPA